MHKFIHLYYVKRNFMKEELASKQCTTMQKKKFKFSDQINSLQFVGTKAEGNKHSYIFNFYNSKIEYSM